MPTPATRFAALGVFAMAAIYAGGGLAQTDAKPKPAPGAADKSGDGVARYCENVAPLAAEARIAWQTKRLTELDNQIRQRIAELDAKEAEARDWVTKRQTMMNAASEDVVAIYAKMDPEAASSQLAAMDEAVAAAVLAKLKPNVASTILNEMDAAKAGKLTSIMSAAIAQTPPAATPASTSAPPAAPAVAEKKS
jgi:flagellar motility protein MotE (MotC chaperone)